MSHDSQRVARSATEPRGEPTRVQSVERAAALLRAVAAATGAAATATALAETVGLNRTTTWRILATLEQQRLVALDRASGRYSLGFGLIDLAGQAGEASLIRSSRAVLRRIAARTGETLALSVMHDDQLVYVAEETPNAAFLAGWRGNAASMHATATGKALLAYSDPADLRDLLDLPRGKRLPRLTSSTITSLAELKKDLEATRARGYSISRGESMVSAWGLAAPVLDVSGRPVAIVTLWGPPERVTEDRFTELGTAIVRGAEEISGRLSPS